MDGFSILIVGSVIGVIIKLVGNSIPLQRVELSNILKYGVSISYAFCNDILEIFVPSTPHPLLLYVFCDVNHSNGSGNEFGPNILLLKLVIPLIDS